MKVLIAIIVAILTQAIGAGVICGLTFLICMAFGFNFTIWLGLGIWAIAILIKVLFGD